MDITFEKVNTSHLEHIAEIYSYYVLNTTYTFHCHVLNTDEIKNLVIFTNQRNCAFLIRLDGNVAGYVILGKHSEREAFNDTGEVAIYLKPEFCGKGIGGHALRFIEDYARKMGFHVLIATICTENSKSIRLFERNGYVKCGHYREVGKKFGRLLDLAAYQKIFE
ncbi:MAG: N-acetyltransferase [Clostridiaceae bacterium]|nr:N-acetyltransferase [Clostridiaceae bacterium]